MSFVFHHVLSRFVDSLEKEVDESMDASPDRQPRVDISPQKGISIIIVLLL